MRTFPSSRCSPLALRLFYLVAFVALAGVQGRAASDTDVYVTKAKSVIIEEDKITIVAEAETTKINLFAPPAKSQRPHQDGAKGGGSKVRDASSRPPVGYTNRRTFIIRRPILKFNDPKGTLAKERAKYQKTLDDAWKMSLEAAKDLQDGKKVGRIGYYRPTFLADSIDGFGYLYPGSKSKAEQDSADQPAAASESKSEGQKKAEPKSEERSQ